MLAWIHRFSLAACLLAICSHGLDAQITSPKRDPHDSISVTTLTFPGAVNVSADALKPLIYTRGSPCRLPFLIPVCKLTRSQVVIDRRRTSEQALGEDITKLRVYYWKRGFREAQIDTVLTQGPRGFAVAFHIVEGEPTRISTLMVVQRAEVLTVSEVAELAAIRQGDPLDLVALDSTVAHLRAAVWNKGYGDVRIDTTVPRPDASHLVPVRIDIDPRWMTRVGEVHFQGNTYLDEQTLRRGITLQPGTLYTRDAILESQKLLYRSPALSRALVVTPTLGDSIKNVMIAVTETTPHQVSATVGFNTVDFGQAAVEIRHNDLGAGRWLSIRAAAANLFGEQLNGHGIFHTALPADVTGDPQGFLSPTYQASATLTQPWIAGARTSASLTAFAGRRSVPNVVIDEDYGATVGIVRDLAPRTPIGINYRMEATRVQGSAVYFCAGYGICDGATRDALSRTQRLAPVGVSAWIDRADDLEVPTTGYTAVVDAEHASSLTGSTFAHNRISADASYYRVLGTRKIVAGEELLPKVLALHGRTGYVRPLSSDRASLGIIGDGEGILHPRARFYAGGMQSVRGFAENELGPEVLQVRRASLLAVGCTDASIASAQCDAAAVPADQLFARPVGGSSVIEGSIEARIPLQRLLGAVLFLDGAYVGTGGLASPAHGRGAVTPGFGFRYRSPLGVLRLDVGLRPVGTEVLPVVVAVDDAAGERIIRLAKERSYSPIEASPSRLTSLARRLVVHFAMGQAF
ncbi:MAG: surface antigen [Gemmatimonadetes bacterium]|nr:surface antigen [Gemmatimonadota bacterium]